MAVATTTTNETLTKGPLKGTLVPVAPLVLIVPIRLVIQFELIVRRSRS